jgi:GTP-binding protein
VIEAGTGEIVCISGIPDINIGDTLCPVGQGDPMPMIKIEEPTLSMNFMVNDSPFAGQVGKYVTSRNIRERLEMMCDGTLEITSRETGGTKVTIRIPLKDAE